jgi:hypothetical protein
MTGHHLTSQNQYNNGYTTNFWENELLGEVQQNGQKEALSYYHVVSCCGDEEKGRFTRETP